MKPGGEPDEGNHETADGAGAGEIPRRKIAAAAQRRFDVRFQCVQSRRRAAEQYVALALIISVDRAAAVAGGAGKVVDRGLFKALLGKERFRRRQYARAVQRRYGGSSIL